MTLIKGSQGPQVVELQNLLNAAGSQPRLIADGDFGSLTDQSLRYFQSRHTDQSGRPLEVDGEVGDRTWWALRSKGGSGVPASPPKQEVGGSLGKQIARLALGEAQKGVREVGGKNTGPDVRKYQRATGLGGTGWAWCAAFVTWCYESAGLVLRSAWGFSGVADLESWGRKTGKWKPRIPGYVAPTGAIVIFKFSHTAIVISGDKSADITVEGNTSSGNRGSQRDGDGVFQRTRSHSIIKGYVVLPEILKDEHPSRKAS
jgi:peptidoglycan hydrolase-like protein with peptidoglycan-binding domain